MYDVLAPTELADSLVEQKALASDYRKRLGEEGHLFSMNLDLAKLSESPLPQRFREILLAKEYKNLVWITHVKPFMIYIPSAIGQQANNGFYFPASYYIFDLPTNRIVFAGRRYFGRRFAGEGDSIKYFLEKDNLRVLREMTEESISGPYKVSDTMATPEKVLTVGQFLGLEERPTQ